jgi:hypothetical protein
VSPTEVSQNQIYETPANRNLNLMNRELMMAGRVRPETWAMLLDEEKTQASEILAQIEQDGQKKAFAAIPRTYFPSSEGLRDRHGQELTRIFDDGVNYIGQQVGRVPGADWEHQRRQTERQNLEKIINMPEGTVVMEISASPSDKPKHEQSAQHYNGLTMIRASIKAVGDGGRVQQYNYAIALDSPEFLLAVQAKLGIAEPTVDSQQLLENPVIVQSSDSAESTARRIDGLIGAALLESAVGKSTLRMLARAVEQRREAWEFINSPQQADLEHELFIAMSQAAQLDATGRSEAIKAIRTGYWRELIDRFNGRLPAAGSVELAGTILAEAAARAVADGDVFIACGDTVQAKAMTHQQRTEMMHKLRNEVTGNGACQACGKKGMLYGCGLCSGCNKKWCDAYEASGEQTDLKDLAYRRLTRSAGGEDFVDRAAKILGEEWRVNRMQWLKKRQKLADAA